jgi:hypothetical protein
VTAGYLVLGALALAYPEAAGVLLFVLYARRLWRCLGG